MRGTNVLARAIGALAIISTCTGPVMAAGPITPIQHVVVIFQENVSFDHYFGTYPFAANTGAPGEPIFHADPGTPTVNNLLAAGLLSHNPNLVTPNGNPFRLTRAQAATCDQDHDYTHEQAMFDLGLMDNFLVFNTSSCGGLAPFQPTPNAGHPNDLIMGYYDGNTVTAFWNYAQNFAMNDNSFGTGFGPSTPGAINLISGNTNGATNISLVPPAAGDVVADGSGGFSVINDAQPAGDICTGRENLSLAGKNVGDLLNTAGVTWGNFAGGFDLHGLGKPACSSQTHTSATGVFVPKVDYIPHHEGFQYYPSTENANHLRPSSVALIGQTDGSVNHQYDLHDFFDAVSAGNFPAVSFLKADGYQDGHAGYSSPLDEQTFVVNTINFIEKQPEWANTLIVIAYDDSDGWYDHQMSPIVSQSNTTADVGPAGSIAHPNVKNAGKHLCGTTNTDGIGGRCGYGPRLPFIVISPFAKKNYVDHSITDQSSILAFIEDNWSLPRISNSMDAIAGPITNMLDFSNEHAEGESRTLFLDPGTGQPLHGPGHGHD
jgi:phospholipase C